jgi:hypothetical protein
VTGSTTTCSPSRTSSTRSPRQLWRDVRISCTYGMLQFLVREQRIIYLLVDLTDTTAIAMSSRNEY